MPEDRPVEVNRCNLLTSLFPLVSGHFRGVPSTGFEPAHPAPEADALSPELRGRGPESLAVDGPAGHGGPYSVAMPSGTVLVVDDDPVIVNLLQVNFEIEGYDVLAATGGQAGLAQARAGHPDVIVMDVMMPGIDGIEVARLLKDDEATRSIPIILLSAKAQTSDIQAGLAVADEYITKPFEPLELLERVATVISRAASPGDAAPRGSADSRD